MAEVLARKSGDRPMTPGRALYLDFVSKLGQVVADTDCTDVDAFHETMWLIMNPGGLNQTAFAERHGYQPSTVSRWANGTKAPPVLRRSPILRDAYAQLKEMVEDGRIGGTDRGGPADLRVVAGGKGVGRPVVR